MADNLTNPQAPNLENAASVPIPSDKEIPYTVNGMPGKAAFPGPDKGLPGHKQADPRTLAAEVAARHRAAVNAAVSKSNAQLRADLRSAPKGRQGK